jgi:uncharacterized protein YecE (DUF72 family)
VGKRKEEGAVVSTPEEMNPSPVNKHNRSGSKQATLFELDKAHAVAAPPARKEVGRPFEATGILLGTSSFTAKGWQGTFYPEGTRSQEFLSYYAGKFRTVEIDSTFYGTPRPSTVLSWKDKTPADFVFALKVPQIVTHEKILVGCEPEFDEFIETVSLLGEKLGPMLFQFPNFDKWMLNDSGAFLARLDSFFKRITNPALRFAVEIRNKSWLDARLTDFLRERNVALALTDTSFMPRPWEMKEKFDLITADFAYVRWLGDRKGIEKQTTTWDKVVFERTGDLRNWVDVLKDMVNNKKIRKLFAYANNHYQGFAPATVKLFLDLWDIK